MRTLSCETWPVGMGHAVGVDEAIVMGVFVAVGGKVGVSLTGLNGETVTVEVTGTVVDRVAVALGRAVLEALVLAHPPFWHASIAASKTARTI